MGRVIGKRPNWKKAIVTLAAGPDDRVLRGSVEQPWVIRTLQADLARAPRHGRAGLRRASPRDEPREDAHSRRKTRDRRPQPPRPHHLALPRRRPQAALPHRSTSSATRSACRPRSRRSSTIRTAPRASRCCTTPTARSATSSRPTASRSATRCVSSRNADIKPGNCLPLRFIPLGTDDPQHRAQDRRRRAARAARPARARSSWPRKATGRQVRLPSGEVRRVHLDCRATVGQVGNVEHGTSTSARPAARAGSAAARTTAASP